MKFSDKTALVTGAASGIGAAVARELAAQGATVIATDINRTLLEATFKSHPTVITAELDVRNEANWASLFSNIETLDILVASAGISHAAPLQNISLDDWHRVMAVNLDGVFLAVRHASQKMLIGGSIVLIGSASGIKAAPGASAYSTSKAALRMFAKCAALELKPQNIRVNTVSPAGVATPLWKGMEFFQDLVTKHGSEEAAWAALGGIDPNVHALHRMAFPEEIAKAVLFLCGEDSAGITGTDLIVDAGYTL